RAIRDSDFLATVEVNAVSIRVDLKIIAGPVIHAGCEDSEMPAMINREITEDHIPAVLQRNVLITHACGKCVAARVPKRAGNNLFDRGANRGRKRKVRFGRSAPLLRQKIATCKSYAATEAFSVD